jgi:glycosyltransferase involved in cell wall biosynthesis
VKVVYVTAGAAGMFCGSCMHDNALVRTLRELGCDVLLVPTFTPIRTDEEDVSLERVFLGGVNVYLAQRWLAHARFPHAVKRWLDSPWLLRGISRLALQTRRAGDGALAISLLRGEHGDHRRETEDLVEWLARDARPDLIHLSNLLIAGFVPALRRRLDVPVLVTLQGDDSFLDSLPEAERPGVLTALRRAARTVDAFVVHSDFYREHMAALLDIPPERFHRVRLGLAEPQSFAPAAPAGAPRPPTLGYLARICPEKGLHVLVDAFSRLRRMPGTEDARLRAGGWLGAADRSFFESQRGKLAASAAGGAFEHVSLPDRASKIRVLHGLDVFSVPAVRPEPKGLYVLEALAAGVPAVLPAHGAFPELARESGGVSLVPPGDPDVLAASIHALLCNPRERRRLGEEGRRGVRERCDATDAARDTLALWRRCTASGGPAPTAVTGRRAGT